MKTFKFVMDTEELIRHKNHCIVKAETEEEARKLVSDGNYEIINSYSDEVMHIDHLEETIKWEKT